MVGSVAAVTNERSNVGGDCVVAASAADSVAVPWGITRGEERCWHPCNRFGDVCGGEGNAIVQWVHYIP